MNHLVIRPAIYFGLKVVQDYAYDWPYDVYILKE